MFQEKQGFTLSKATGFGWSVFTKVCVGYYNNALKDTKLVKKKQNKQKKNLQQKTDQPFLKVLAKNLQDLI